MTKSPALGASFSCCEVVENEKTYTLSASDIIFHSPDEFHRLKSSGGTAPKTITYSLIVEGDLPSNLKKGVFHLTDGLLEELCAVFEMLGREIGNNFDGGCDYTALEEINYNIRSSSLSACQQARTTIFQGMCENQRVFGVVPQGNTVDFAFCKINYT